RTDLWAVGATMYMLITGQLVHKAETVQLLIAKAILDAAPKVATKRADVPPKIAALVDRALAFDKTRRFANAREMQMAVRDAAIDLGQEIVARQAWRTLASARSPAIPSIAGATPHSAPRSDVTRPPGTTTTSQGVISSVSPRTSRGSLAIGLSAVALLGAIVIGARLVIGGR